MTLIDLIALAAACWYIAYVVSTSEGPFAVFKRLRALLPLGGLTACIICLAFWVAQLLALVTGHTFIEGLAIAGTALWLHSFFGWRYSPSGS